MSKPILPGATLGMLGSGQLGRMFALAAHRLGYRVHIFSPHADTPAGQAADREVCAPYDDLDAIRSFAQGVQVVTFEFENVPAATARAAAEHAPLRPGFEVLDTVQDRLREKRFLVEAGFPVTPFRAVTSIGELSQALDELGYPAVIKTAQLGYDGKGQAKIGSPADLEAAWQQLGTRRAIVESFIDFKREVSVIAARSVDGAVQHFPVIENHHCKHILDLSMTPADVSRAVKAEAVEIAQGVVEQLGVVGLLCVEMFVTANDQLLINELAPRPHNSGHLTVDAFVTSQFEQHLRAICGLPLGSPKRLGPAAMANLLGDLWQDGEPNWEAACRFPEVKLHLYGKSEPRPGRKMGHLTAVGTTVAEALEAVQGARRALRAKV